jgi:SAM-dependent methyltransferase
MDGDSLTAATQRLYDALARRHPALKFLNFGYDDPDTPAGEKDEAEVAASSRRLYDAVLAGLPAVDRLVEVGCGRGAGASFVLSSRPVGEYVGIDLSVEHARLCRGYLRTDPRARFAVADARELPLASASFDAAYSIEAAQHFEDRPRCFREIARALRPGGRFFLGAIWRAGEVESDDVMAACGLRVVEHEDITAHVLRSLARSSDVRVRIVDSLAWPDHMRPLLQSFVGVRGSEIYEWFVSGELVYHRFVLERIQRRGE